MRQELLPELLPEKLPLRLLLASLILPRGEIGEGNDSDMFSEKEELGVEKLN